MIDRSRANRHLLSLIIIVAMAVLIACSTDTKTGGPSQSSSKPETKIEAVSKNEAAGKSEAAGKIETVNAAFSSSAASENPLWVATEKGLFDKYGVKVNVTQITGGSSTVVQAMLGGNVDIAQIGATAVVDANLQGAGFVVVADIINRLAMSLYSSKEIAKVEDLKGKSIAVTRAGTITDFGGRYVLKKAGLEPEKEVGIIQSGGLPEALAALQSGNVKGALLLSPHTLKAKDLGFKELVDLGKLDLEFQVNGLVVSKKWLAQHGSTLEKFLKGYLEGIAFAKKNKDATKAVIGKYTKTTDQVELDDGYDLYVTKYLSTKPYPSAVAIQNVLDFVVARDPKAKELKAQEMIDTSFVKKLDESGFIDGLYK